MELVGGSCEEAEEEVGGLGGASLEEGCWSVVGREGGVGGEGSAGELVEGERRRRRRKEGRSEGGGGREEEREERVEDISHVDGHISITSL